jgi:hypothetical protein
MIPPQEQVDWKQPEQHFAWALKNMPTFFGNGAVTHPSILTTWSKHLWDAGFAHRDYLEGLADEDGNIHVSKLPQQVIRWQPPFRGPNSTYNNAARWVSADTEPVRPMRIPDIRELTQQENEYMIKQYRDAGLIQNQTVGAPLAEEVP